MPKPIGKITHYYSKIGVAVLELNDNLSLGDWVQFLGHTTDFTQLVTSLEIDHQKVDSAGAGEEVALKVIRRIRPGDEIYKIKDEITRLGEEIFYKAKQNEPEI